MWGYIILQGRKQYDGSQSEIYLGQKLLRTLQGNCMYKKLWCHIGGKMKDENLTSW